MISTFDNNSCKGKSIDDSYLLLHPKVVYHAIQSTSDDFNINDHMLVASIPYHFPYWLESPPPYLDDLLQTFPFDKYIMELMCLYESPWGGHHH